MLFHVPKKQLLLIVPKFKLLAPLKEPRWCQSRLCKDTQGCERRQDVQLSHKFLKQTSDNKWYNAMAQVRDNLTIFFDRTACSSSSLSVTQPLYIAPTLSQCTVLRASLLGSLHIKRNTKNGTHTRTHNRPKRKYKATKQHFRDQRPLPRSLFYLAVVDIL